MRRIRREGERPLVGDRTHWAQLGGKVCDTERILYERYDQGDQILIEGTQGILLDLVFGDYPYTTHRQPTPAQWLQEAGLATTLPHRVVSVFRTFPIRVAGNSGPLPHELSWPEFSRLAGLPIPEETLLLWEEQLRRVEERMRLEERGENFILRNAPTQALKELPPRQHELLSRLWETTTVTRKLRRIAAFSEADAQKSVRRTRPQRLVLSFLDYRFHEPLDGASVQERAEWWMEGLSERLKTPVAGGTWGTGEENFQALTDF